ncbi:dopamine receptor 2 isoform X1, partial [Vespula maculifrons]
IGEMIKNQRKILIFGKSTAALLPDASNVFVTLTIKANIRRESSVKIMQDFVASNRNNTAFPEWERADRQVALVIAALVKAAMVVSACLEVVYLILAECDVTQGPVRGHDEKERYVSVMRDTSGHSILQKKKKRNDQLGGTYDEEREQDLTMLRPKDVQQIAFIYNY